MHGQEQQQPDWPCVIDTVMGFSLWGRGTPKAHKLGDKKGGLQQEHVSRFPRLRSLAKLLCQMN